MTTNPIMARHLVQKFDPELPHADIYLDDLQEIEAIIRTVYAEARGAKECQFQYEVDSEAIFDSIEDLKQHGGHSSNFYMRVDETEEPGYGTIVRFYGSLNPKLNFPYWLGANRRWELKARIEDIFRRRENHFKIVASSGMVWGLSGIGVVTLVVTFIAALWVALETHFVLAVYLPAIVSAIFVAIDRRKNRVNFYYERTRTLERQKDRQQFWRSARIAILGSFVGGALVLLAQLAIEHFKH